jgi:hypothetical protein
MPKGTTMRPIVLAFAAFLAVSPAQAQSWQEYTYPVYSFSVSFPSEPKVETTMYQAFNGRMVEARVYSVTSDGNVLKMTIADLSDGDMEEKPVIDHAIKTLSADGEIKVDIPHRISAVYGRQLAISGADGSHNSVAVFFYKRRLYQIEGKAASGDGTANAIRFQQSLSFTDGQSNRSPGGRLFEVFGRLF